MSSNFDFLLPHFKTLHKHATQAESLIHSAPRASCFYARFTLEQAVIWLYDNDNYLQLPYDKSLGALIHEQTFKENLSQGLFPKIRLIQKLGNLAVHDNSAVPPKDALYLNESLFQFLYWLCRYYSPTGKTLGDLKFDRNLVPTPSKAGAPSAAAQQAAQLTQQQLKDLETKLTQTDELKRIAEKRSQQTEDELAQALAELDQLKAANTKVADNHNYNANEAETRKYLIDVLLREAGWNPSAPNATEVEVTGMPVSTNPSGKGYIDYVLWGDDGNPLAVVEAKRAHKSPNDGKHQAKLYADCLEAQYSQRPVIFYTNGYNTWLWDDHNYPPRQIQGFLKKAELERLIFRRTSRKKLHLVQPNLEIAGDGRPYQIEAIQRITEGFQQKGRKGLLVMATGTGKTRTSIALIDLLIRANWAKRILFLADRTSLVTQAYRAFQRHLPNVTPIDLTQNKKDIDSANVILSTYPTMLNFLEQTDSNGRIVGPGHFDLVIVDEAHRSIYQKYSFLFEYFDSLLVGLTATPRDEVHRDTYRIFELEDKNPTFAYELNDAVADGKLVPAKGVDVPFKFLRTGLKYADLSPEEKEEYENKFRDDEGNIPDKVNAAALNRWLFNEDTVDKALAILMERGLKVEGGDQLGKTIIFARNQKHAEFIVDRFNASYKQYNGHFAQVIHSKISNAQSLLDEFGEKDKQPTIAVSVDMLDTGVDIPEVVNLVFFKPVYSEVKFNQMIGRGTRLRKDLYGIGRHKDQFLVFDLCGNFDFFKQELKETSQKPSESLTTRLVKTRLELAQLLAQPSSPASTAADTPIAAQTGGTYTTGNDDLAVGLRDRLLNDLHQHVATMEPENVLVRRHLQPVEEFGKRDRWNSLSDQDQELIVGTLAPLPNGLPVGDRLAKDFDLLCYKVQLALLKQTPDFVRLRDKIRDLMSQLEQKRDIPMVKEQLQLIEQVESETWWTDVTLELIDKARRKLRDLVKFIDRTKQDIVYTDFEDELVGDIQEVAVPTNTTGFSPYQYRKKVEAYIRDNENHVAIAKLKRNLPLTETDLNALEQMLFDSQAVEGRERFEQVFGKDLSLKLFIRKLVGLDRNAAKEAFSQYLEGNAFSANQIRFVETIIDYLTQQGVMDISQLYEPPFTEAHPEGLDGIFSKEADADGLVAIVRSFNETVEAKFGAA